MIKTNIQKYMIALFAMGVLLSCEKDFSMWKEKNEAWLKNNKTELLDKYGDFVSTFNSGDCGITASGVQYEIFHRGFGGIPKVGSLVMVNYDYYLIDGTRIEYYTSDLEAKGVYELPRGVQEIVCLMPQGSSFKIYVPYGLGYGKDGNGNEGNLTNSYHIPPYSTMIIEMEIVDVLQYPPY
ncbi:MAG: FKBP-type peptidyl-prolyl cis-trans isomerase [Prevotellaceae bacterium]|nr:FKBP-type peptidyl-prolyl cis-trans isomerase [Prevotellaceae bacterium]